MKSVIGKKEEYILPPRKQLYITIETQEEIDQLFAMLNYVPVIEALNIESSDWVDLREKLPKSENYTHWHRRLCGV